VHGRPLLPLCGPLLLSALAGCGGPGSGPAEPPAPPAECGTEFDPSSAGALSGRVTWAGGRPSVAPYRTPLRPLSGDNPGPWRALPNPNAPAVDPATGGVGGAVVSLRGLDPRRGRPWDLPGVRVEARGYALHVLQGGADRKVGFVRRGTGVGMVSRDAGFHSLQARGADFFARALPDPNEARTRVLGRRGVVELSSGAGYFWMRAYLFVDDHPYYAATDRRGRFTLPGVPPGEYEVVCWLPDWHEAERELDGETALLCRVSFRPPHEWVKRVRVAARQKRDVSFTPSAADFGQ
jgi:hypothetical protein